MTLTARIRLARVDGAFERLLSLLSRKRVRIEELHLTAHADEWDLVICARLNADRFAHVISVVEREPLVLGVAHTRESGR